MDVKSCINLEQLLEQIIMLNPELRDSPEQLSLINKKLEEQLVKGEAVIRVERVNIELASSFDPLAENIEQRIKRLKSMLNTNTNQEGGNKKKTGKRKSTNVERIIKVEELPSDSSDDEALIFKKFNRQVSVAPSSSVGTINQSEENYFLNEDISLGDRMNFIPLSLRRTPRKRKKSSNFKYENTSPIKSRRSSREEQCNYNCSKSYQRQEAAISSSGVIHPCEENIIVEQGVTSRSFHIKIPSLFKGAVHELNFCELDISRKVIDARAKEARRKLLQNENKSSQNNKKSHKKKQLIGIDEYPGNNYQQERDDAEISQLINDVIGASGNEDETWQATNALENINNEIIDNYDVLSGFNSAADFIGFEKHKSPKRSYNKSSSKSHSNEENKKRGRKPKFKARSTPQPPTKSNLAQYVENFSNNCDVMCGSTTPAASSTMSQPLVSSTTQNFELIDQQQTRPVMYYFDGNWANGGPCQLVTANGMPLDAAQIQSTDLGNTDPFQETDLDGNISLPIIPQFHQFQQTKSTQNVIVSPVINIQIPKLPITTTTAAYNAAPPPAHTTPGVLDLSLKSNINISNTSSETISYDLQQDKVTEYEIAIEDCDNEAIPLDLSANTTSEHNDAILSLAQQNSNDLSESLCILVDNGQDDDFIRRLIETSDFDLGLHDLQGENDDSKSFKAALDMPLLESTAENCDGVLNDSTTALQIDSTYASMNENTTNYLSCTFGEDYQFVDQSTKEIFNQLLELGDKTATNNNDRENIGKNSMVCLDEATFHSDTSTQVETGNNYQTDDKNKDNCQEGNSDMMIKQTVAASSDNTVHTDDNSLYDNINNNRMAVMKWVPRILKRRHMALSCSAETQKKQDICTASTPKKIDCSNVLKSPKKKYAKTFTMLQSEKMPNENKVRIFRTDRKVLSNIDSEKKDCDKAIDIKETNELEEPRPLEEMNGHHELKVIRETIDNDEPKVLDELIDIGKPEVLDETMDIDEAKDPSHFDRATNDGCNHLDEAKVHDEVHEIEEVTFFEEIMDTYETEDLDCNCVQAVSLTHTTNLESGCILHQKNDIYEANVLDESGESTNTKFTDEAKHVKEDIDAAATVQNDVNAASSCTGHVKSVKMFPENIGFELSINKTANESIEVKDIYEVNNYEKDFDVPKNNDGTKDVETIPASTSAPTVNNLQNETKVADMSSLQNCNNANKRQIIDLCASIKLKDSVNNEFIPKDHSPIQTMTTTGTANLQKSLQEYSGTLQNLKNDSNMNLITDLCMPMSIDSVEDLSLNSKIHNKELQNLKLQRNVVTETDVQHFNISKVNRPDKNSEEYTYCKCETATHSSESDNTTFATKEKVVFSMAKINLNDEHTNLDYLFLSDSDNNSRKSCDEISQSNITYDTEMQLQPADFNVKTSPNELMKEEEEDTFPTLILSGSVDGGEIHEVDSSECNNSQLDWNVSKHENIATETEEESRDYVVTNEEIGVKSSAVSVIEDTDDDTNEDLQNHLNKNEYISESDENQNSVDVTKSVYPELHMSLLEMESKLDQDTLNFEDDDDLDALILDTSSSCFDSPNEDRFKDSLVNECIDQTNVYVPLTSSAATNVIDDTVQIEQFTAIDEIIKVDVPKLPSLDSIIKTKPSSSSSLMSFKIPKLNICSGFKAKPNEEHISEGTKTKSTIRCANVPNIYDIRMQPYVKLAKITVKEGCRINVKDFNEMTKPSDGVIDKKSEKFNKIKRTIKNEPGDSSKIEIPQQLQNLPKFKSTFKNITTMVSKEQHQPIADRLNGVVTSQVGIQQPRLLLQSNFKCNITAVSRLNPGLSTGGGTHETVIPQPQQQQQISFPCQPNFKCVVKNISAVVNSEQFLLTNTKSNTDPSKVGCVSRQTCTKNDIQEIAHIFGVTCLPHLVNECIAPTHCQKSHQFNGNDVVFHTLKTLDMNQLHVAYSFMYSHLKLFSRYFVMFCNLFCMQKDRDKLLNMINDCERYPEYADFLLVLYDSLIKSGLSPSNACRQLLKRTRERSVPIINALVAIIMKSDWTMFSDYIESFTHEMYKYNYRMGILEQMAPAVLNSSKQQVHLKNIFFKCVQTLHCDDVPSLCACSSNLMQCLALMATTENGER